MATHLPSSVVFLLWHRILDERIHQPLLVLTGPGVVNAETGVPLPVSPAKLLLFKPAGQEPGPLHP